MGKTCLGVHNFVRGKSAPRRPDRSLKSHLLEPGEVSWQNVKLAVFEDKSALKHEPSVRQLDRASLGVPIADRRWPRLLRGDVSS